MSTLVETISPVRERGAARVAFAVAAVAAGSLLIAGLAQLSIRLPFTPVPITGQTLGVLVVGTSLGPVLGAAAVLLYLAEGAVGLPFYAEGRSGAEVLGLASATGGYLWGFVLAAALVGWLARQGWDRSLGSSVGAMLLGEIVLYAVGLVWLARAVGVRFVDAASVGACAGPPAFTGCDALELGLYPFVVGDLLKLLVAAVFLPAAWRLAGRNRSDR